MTGAGGAPDAAEAGGAGGGFGAMENGIPTPGMAAKFGGNAADKSTVPSGFLGLFGFRGFVASPGCFRGRPRFLGV
jgi:hypothetical protein